MIRYVLFKRKYACHDNFKPLMLVFHDHRTPLIRFCGKMILPQNSLVMTFAVNMLQQEKFTAKVTSSDICGKNKMIIFIIARITTFGVKCRVK